MKREIEDRLRRLEARLQPVMRHVRFYAMEPGESDESVDAIIAAWRTGLDYPNDEGICRLTDEIPVHERAYVAVIKCRIVDPPAR